ncbi:MAG TPA: efflux RND transporter periplasmic adaptor subunit [Erythrobacter sp.]|jgi:HlyD family secretion protein|uniref:Efflux RND transporter periplasmic adaptor subunit n=2 Tax=Qipengyuania citrea TaxID=225971 RepID=A0A6I4U961_9SPHN|nr:MULTISPECIES: efflux RND transporter periplasmic adaptor subunit [Erythrobacteraceae]MBN91324.1 efflux RND transporter periplasmic adaptor subunit [Erythrobacteraceae bacterium]MCZ4264230.1 efflux RND transporter periplasmic adaptor subunit [Erythrobacter sp. G21629-S1]HAL89918.1 efflux RND transporter periplasmic adaptor subunit [Erythrobacter sp.]KNH00659.1 putative Co/Zn/Cd efflux system membrane fusion protein [Qipengyuania citrea LAMA 915]KZY94496.1 efflux transporter periplasmic adapt
MNYESGVMAEKGDPITVDFDPDEDDRLEKRRTDRRRIIIIAGLIVLGLAIAAYFAMRGGTTTPAGEENAQAPTVTVVRPGRTTVEGEITATGSLAARREMPVGVVGEGGRVVSVPVDAGDWVSQGQVLARIDRSVQSQQVQSFSAQVQVAQSDADLAQANLDRALQLVERGFVSQADVDRLTATRDAAVARVRVAQAQLAELRARNARLDILAPAAGYVLERNVEPGQTVSAGSPPLFRIARGGEMELLARLNEDALASISPGTRAQVRPVGTDKLFTGQVWQVSPIISEQDRQGTARIALSYAPGLRPGGFATATIASGTVVAPILPESAVLSDEDGAYVLIINGEDKAERRAVTTGTVTSKGIVIAEGLNGSERVVLRAGGFLTEGETVRTQLAELDD